MTEFSKRNRFRTWRERIREGGLDSIFYALTWRLPAWFFRYTHAYLVLANDLDVVAPDTKAFQFRLANLSDADNFALLGVSSKTVTQRLNAGDNCGIAVRPDGMVCSMVWASTGRLYLDGAGTILDCDPEGVYVYNSFTLAELRGHSLYRGCSAAVCDWFKPQGRTVRYGIIDKLNESSFKANGRINLKNSGESRYFRFCGIHVSLLTNWPKTDRQLFVSIGRRTRGARIV